MSGIDEKQLERLLERNNQALISHLDEKALGIKTDLIERVVSGVLIKLGVDDSNPTKMQKIVAYGELCLENKEETAAIHGHVKKDMANKKNFFDSLIAEVGRIAAGAALVGVFIYFNGGGH